MTCVWVYSVDNTTQPNPKQSVANRPNRANKRRCRIKPPRKIKRYFSRKEYYLLCYFLRIAVSKRRASGGLGNLHPLKLKIF
jgi:hypothetical protein